SSASRSASLVVVPGRWPSSISACTTQFLRVSGLIPSCSPTRRNVPDLVAGFRRASTAILVALSRSSSGYFLGAAILPILPWDQSLHQTRGDSVFDLGLKLGLAGRRAGLPGSQRGLACFEELGLPSAGRLLGDLLLPSRFSDGDLAGQHAQHDPGLGLRTEHRWSSHGQVLLLSDADHALITGLPESMTRDRTTALSAPPRDRSGQVTGESRTPGRNRPSLAHRTWCRPARKSSRASCA